jgi:hypothetical protein
LGAATTPDPEQTVVKEAIERAAKDEAGRDNDHEQQGEERGELKAEE